MIRPNVVLALVTPPGRVSPGIGLFQQATGAGGDCLDGPRIDAARRELSHLQDQRRAFLDLHGENAASELHGLDEQIQTLAAEINRPVMIENPTGCELQNALQLAPGGVIACFDDRATKSFCGRVPKQTRDLLRWLGRGNRCETIVVSPGRDRAGAIIERPALSVVFECSGETAAKLLRSPHVKNAGLTDQMLALPCSDANASRSIALGRRDGDRTPRPLEVYGTLTLSGSAKSILEASAREFHAIPAAESLLLKLAIAIHSANPNAGPVINALTATGAVEVFKLSLQTRQRLLDDFASRLEKEAEDILMAKIRAYAPCIFRTIVRKFKKQRAELHRPTLDRLIAKGSVILASDGMLRLPGVSVQLNEQ